MPYYICHSFFARDTAKRASEVFRVPQHFSWMEKKPIVQTQNHGSQQAADVSVFLYSVLYVFNGN
ncbi:hypothetical protein SCLCIDRAFT_1223615 [Scleroderma citrinum Foug A]|uniref:Uncharacterized protein n=1 Tax=Scleroderma citrinum Foug A TaxID=1036808 RepID=A0A0C2YSC1_9AGAM|nr:hypothetical protein SCLCIDRAFT_1223615 [Scleroderma citrinum Foug A]